MVADALKENGIGKCLIGGVVASDRFQRYTNWVKNTHCSCCYVWLGEKDKTHTAHIEGGRPVDSASSSSSSSSSDSGSSSSGNYDTLLQVPMLHI